MPHSSGPSIECSSIITHIFSHAIVGEGHETTQGLILFLLQKKIDVRKISATLTRYGNAVGSMKCGNAGHQ
jgi:hypothetical protein